MSGHRPPRTAQLLGFAGLLPALGAVALRLTGDTGVPALMPVIGLVYGALILSFLGGLWWGAAAARLTDAEMAPVLVLAVLPSLWAMAALLLLVWWTPATGWALAAGLLATLAADRRLVRLRAVPGWWMALRVPLSLGLALCMAALALLAPD